MEIESVVIGNTNRFRAKREWLGMSLSGYSLYGGTAGIPTDTSTYYSEFQFIVDEQFSEC